jgi:hypothetical protein
MTDIEAIRAADGQLCGCIREDCWHPKGRCDEPPRQRYGTCSTCQYHKPPKKCPACGQALPEEAE